jgi:DNA-3-methyladenine glycosylase II
VQWALPHWCGTQSRIAMQPESATTAHSPLTDASFEQGLRALREADERLADVYLRLGPPPFWQRDPGFPTLLRIILEQQVSLASALATFRRVAELADPLTPRNFLALSDEELRGAGFSRQKTAYGRALARALLDGELDLDALHSLADDDVRESLTCVKGIGPWTAEVYLLMALRRPDVWPTGDLALAVAVQEVLRLPERPGPQELEALGSDWKPWRAVAARLFWHHYLSTERIDGRGNRRAGRISNAVQGEKSSG